MSFYLFSENKTVEFTSARRVDGNNRPVDVDYEDDDESELPRRFRLVNCDQVFKVTFDPLVATHLGNGFMRYGQPCTDIAYRHYRFVECPPWLNDEFSGQFAFRYKGDSLTEKLVNYRQTLIGTSDYFIREFHLLFSPPYNRSMIFSKQCAYASVIQHPHFPESEVCQERLDTFVRNHAVNEMSGAATTQCWPDEDFFKDVYRLQIRGMPGTFIGPDDPIHTGTAFQVLIGLGKRWVNFDIEDDLELVIPNDPNPPSSEP